LGIFDSGSATVAIEEEEGEKEENEGIAS